MLNLAEYRRKETRLCDYVPWACLVAPGIVLNDLWGISDPAEIDAKADAGDGLRSEDVAEAALFMLTRPRNVTIRDLVILPRAQQI